MLNVLKQIFILLLVLNVFFIFFAYLNNSSSGSNSSNSEDKTGTSKDEEREISKLFYSTPEDLTCQQRQTMQECLKGESDDAMLQKCVWCSTLSICISGNQVEGPQAYKKHCPYWCGYGTVRLLLLLLLLRRKKKKKE